MKNTKERELRKKLLSIWNHIGFRRFLYSILVAFIYIGIISYKYETLFWIYMAIMIISTLIFRWNGYRDKKKNPNRFLDIVDEVFWIIGVAFFLGTGYLLLFLK